MALRTVSGPQEYRHFLMIHGAPGVGKTTFLSEAPNVIFLQSEHGTKRMDVERYKFSDDGRVVARTWSEFDRAIDDLQNEKHGFDYVAIDTLDVFEPLAWDDMISKHPPKKQNDLPIGMKTIEVYGYNKGYRAVIDELWFPLLKKLERLNDPVSQGGRNMGVLIAAHTGPKKKVNVDGEDYQANGVQCNAELAGLFVKHCETVLYAMEEVIVSKSDNPMKRSKAIGTLPRVCKTTDGPTWDAKNRFNLPPEIELKWSEFDRLSRGDSWATVMERISAMVLPEALAAKRAKQLAAIGSDVEKLRRFEHYLVAEQQKAEQQS